MMRGHSARQRTERGVGARRRTTGDAGFSLIEVMVSMAIMSVFMAMFTTTIVAMFRAANKVEAVSAAQSQISIAFQRLDKEIRYAEGISTPMSDSTGWYVEYLTTHTGTPVCTQLWLDEAAGQLKHRFWNQVPSPTSIPDVKILASRVSSAQPFTVSDADANFNFQRLRLRLTASSGSGTTASSKETDVTFTAINTSISTSTPTVCSDGRLIPW